MKKSPTIEASCLKCRAPMIRSGHFRKIQRWKCTECGGTCSASGHAKVGAKIVRKPKHFERAKALFLQGASIRQVMAQVGISSQTAKTYRRLALGNEIVKCGCGKEVGHKGWCSYLVSLSPKRQSFLQRWNIASKTKHLPAVLSRVPSFCVGTLDQHTAVSIKRCAASVDGEWESPETTEEYLTVMNSAWRAARDLGCRQCGKVSKYGCPRRCRRCLRLHTILRKAEFDIASSVGFLIYQAGEPLRRLAKVLGTKKGLSPGERLRLLISQINGNQKALTTKG